MAKLIGSPVIVTVKATIELNEEEILALDAIAGYGVDQFIETFYTHMGKHYLRPHEKGLRSFLEAVHGEAGRIASKASKCRDILDGKAAATAGD